MSKYTYETHQKPDNGISVVALSFQAALKGATVVMNSSKDYRIVVDESTQIEFGIFPMFEIVLRGSKELLVKDLLDETPKEPDWSTMDEMSADDIKSLAKSMKIVIDGRAQKVDTMIIDFRAKYYRKYKRGV